MQKKLLAENKLILLYLLYQMDISMSVTQMAEFAVDGEYMDYFSFQQYLHELENEELLDSYIENANTFYALTNDGEQVLSYFSKQIPDSKRNNIREYVKKNKRRIRKEVSVIANYFYNGENDYMVKCGIYEDNAVLMEINVTVPTKEDAKLLRKNWRENVPHLYGSILHTLLMQPQEISVKSKEIAEEIAKSRYNDD